jgi:hypothetical protein
MNSMDTTIHDGIRHSQADAMAKRMVDILEEVARERCRQIDKGFGPEHDDEHTDGELADAAAAYAANAAQTIMLGRVDEEDGEPDSTALQLWPFGREDFKPGTAREDLIKSLALTLAEIERIDRAAAKASS